MQPPRFKRVRFLKNAECFRSIFSAGVLALFATALVLTGCGGSTSAGGPSPLEPNTVPGVPSEEIRVETIALLDSMNRSAFDSAFVELGKRPFNRTVRTERLDSTGSVLAFREQTLRYDLPQAQPASSSNEPTPYEVTVIRSDSSGNFDAAVLGRFSPTSEEGQPPSNLAVQAFPKDPAYLSTRKREAFHYTHRDETYEGEPVHVVTIWAKRGEGGTEQSARFAELTVHRVSNELLVAQTVYAERTMLYRQDTRFEVRLRDGPGGVWLPGETTFRATLDMLLRDARHFRTTSTYTASSRS